MRIGLKLFVARKDDKLHYLVYTISDKTFRKRILTGIKLEARHWDERNLRIKASHPSSEILNQEMKSIREKLETANAKHETNQFNRHQVLAYLKGESGIDSVDDYIEKDIKNKRNSATFRDYKNAWRMIKKYSEHKVDEPLPFSAVNFRMLDTAKRAMVKAGLRNSSINGYMQKVRAVMNDAYDNGVTYEPFVLSKKLKLPRQKKQQPSICTPDEFKAAISKVDEIRDWQALGFYLLMFTCRGMYPADIVALRQANFKNGDGDNNQYLKVLCQQGYDYLIHRRHKTKNKANDDMVIRIDENLLHLIEKLKLSVVYTHYIRKPEIIPPIEDSIRIFNYNIDVDNDLHQNVWDNWKKRVSRLLGHSFKTARKTYDTTSAKLDISQTIRQILLGHIEDSMLYHYGDLNSVEISQQVQDAHLRVLEDFETDALIELMMQRLMALEQVKGLPEWLNPENVHIGNLEELVKFN
jgi:hypothetical protein